MTEWMQAGKTAVITGGASGIGFAAAQRYLAAGMNVAIADRDGDTLLGANAKLKLEFGEDAPLLAKIVDVIESEKLNAFKDELIDRFGPVHCLMNNAGTGHRGGKPWENVADMRNLIEVNLWGVVNGAAAFIPSMLEHGEIGAVINTGSKQGITRPPGNIAYNMSKAGVLAYTESLAHAFRGMDDCNLSAHLLVPGFVYTGLVSQFLPEKPPGAATSEETIDFMIDALGRGDFYIICPDNETTREMDEKRMRWTMDDIVENRPALSRWHPDYADAFNTFMKG